MNVYSEVFIISQRKIGAVLGYLNILLQMVVNFLYIPLLLYYIGKEEFGLYQLIGSLIAYFIVMDFGLSDMVVRFYVRYITIKDDIGAENILAIARRGYVILCIFILLIGFVGYVFIPAWFDNTMTKEEIDEGMNIYILLLFNFVITMLGMIYKAVINARQKFLFLRGIACLQTVMQPILVLAILQAWPCAYAVAAATSIVNVLFILWQIVYVKRILRVRIKYHYWNNKLLHGVGHFMLMQVIVLVTDMVFLKTNQVILGLISGTVMVAIYAIAANIQQAYMSLSCSISGVFLPHVTEMVVKNANSVELSSMFIRIGRLQFFILGLVGSGFVIFGQEFIELWAGEGFEDSYWIALLIMLPFTTDLIQNVGFAILQAKNRYGIRAMVQTIMAVINIMLAIPLGMKYGGIGCAAATGLCMFLGNGVGMSYCYSKFLHLQMKKFWGQIITMLFKVSLLTAAVYVVNCFLPEAGGVLFVVKVIAYTAIYGVMAYLFGFNKYERSLCAVWRRR